MHQQPSTVIIVTGAASGIGELTARTLARSGARVYAGMRDPGNRNAAAAKRAAELAAAEGLALHPTALDVTDDDSVHSAVDAVLEDAGRIDVVVNNAGTMSVGVTEAFTIAQVRDQLDVNVLGPARLNRAILPHMRGRGSGLLIHVSSLAGRVTFPFFGVYCASKYALESLAESYRYELSPSGVDSVIVEPGPFPTNLIASRHSPRDSRRVESYGETAEIPAAMLGGFEQMFSGDDSPNPQAVADAIAELIAMPTSERPLRTVVGADLGVVALNEAAAPYAEGLLDGLGLARLASIGVAAGSPA